VSPEDRAVAKVVAALSDRSVSPEMVGIIMRHRQYYADSVAEREVIRELIAGLTAPGP
jgi:hypothetical protein